MGMDACANSLFLSWKKVPKNLIFSQRRSLKSLKMILLVLIIIEKVNFDQVSIHLKHEECLLARLLKKKEYIFLKKRVLANFNGDPNSLNILILRYNWMNPTASFDRRPFVVAQILHSICVSVLDTEAIHWISTRSLLTLLNWHNCRRPTFLFRKIECKLFPLVNYIFFFIILTAWHIFLQRCHKTI